MVKSSCTGRAKTRVWVPLKWTAGNPFIAVAEKVGATAPPWATWPLLLASAHNVTAAPSASASASALNQACGTAARAGTVARAAATHTSDRHPPCRAYRPVAPRVRNARTRGTNPCALTSIMI